MWSAADITLYVPCYRAERTLGDCLASLQAQTITPARIFIIDDGNDTPPMVPAGIGVIRHGHNRGLAAGRNTALETCATELLGSIDSDVVASPDWLENLLATLNAEPGLAGCGGRMDENFQDDLADCWRGVHMCQHWGEQPVRSPRFLYGCNTLMRAEALRAAGGFDPRLRTNNEDRSLSDSLYSMGLELLYQPAARCRHLRRDKIDSVLATYWGWHHAKGLVAGDFDSPLGLLDRVWRVNFGIFDYRYNLDHSAGRDEFLLLDLALPWVFCQRDLELAHLTQGLPAGPDLRALLREITGEGAAVIEELMPPSRCAPGNPPWAELYRGCIRRSLERSSWLRRFDAALNPRSSP